MDERLALLFRNLEVPRLILGLEAGYPDWGCHDFTQFLQENSWILKICQERFHRDLWLSRRWKFKSRSSGLWRWRQQGPPHRHNPEDLDLNASTISKFIVHKSSYYSTPHNLCTW